MGLPPGYQGASQPPGPAPEGSRWMLPTITDYWDSRTNAVFSLSQQLEAISRDDREPVLHEIAICVERHLNALSPDKLETASWIMVDDLYRSVATNLSYWDASIIDYLGATSRQLLHFLTRHGYVLKYFVDNDFAQTVVGLAGPSEWFAHWFRAAGFVYICPQEIARRAIAADDRRADSWTDILPSYLGDARKQAADTLRGCASARSHMVYIEADSEAMDPNLAFGVDATPGTITVVRVDAPQFSAKCAVKITPPLRLPTHYEALVRQMVFGDLVKEREALAEHVLSNATAAVKDKFAIADRVLIERYNNGEEVCSRCGHSYNRQLSRGCPRCGTRRIR